MSNTDLTYGWASITKSHEMPDGSVIVEGRLGGPTEDLDGQYLDKDWLDVAVPKWAKRGNIRAMHQPISAGTAKSVTDTGADWFLQAKINDPVEARKCLDGNYTGFSVGVKNGGVLKTSKMAKNGRPLEAINKGDIVEVSLADFPCDPQNTLSLVDKAATITPEDIEVVSKTADEPAPLDESAASTPVEPTVDPNVPLIPSESESLADFAKKIVEGTADEDKLVAFKALIDQAMAIKAAKDAVVETPEVVEATKAADVDPPKAVTKDIPDLAKAVSAEVAKVVTSDLLKAAVESAIKPLSDRIAEMEKRAMPGGAHVGSMRQLSGSEAHKTSLIQKRSDELTRLLDHPNPSVAAGARDMLLKLAAS